ncbi:MAG: hypothetical protein NT178_01580 [Proteobacteria bacterium]|nr:hypothetical protein [Pseudomonadota bacterium]
MSESKEPIDYAGWRSEGLKVLPRQFLKHIVNLLMDGWELNKLFVFIESKG